MWRYPNTSWASSDPPASYQPALGVIGGIRLAPEPSELLKRKGSDMGSWRERIAEVTAPRPAKSPGWAWLVAGGLVALHLVLAWLARPPGILVINDDANYVLLSRALLNGTYRDLHLIGAPYHAQYPPGWPALLAAGGTLFGDRPDVYFAMAALATAVALLLFFDVIRRHWGAAISLAFLAVAAVNETLLRYSGRVLAEAPLLACLAVTLWALSVPHPSTRRLVAGTVAAIAAALMRTVGAVAIGALVLELLLARRIRAAVLVGLASLVAVGAWLGWSYRAQRQVAGRSYFVDMGVVEGTEAAPQASNRVTRTVTGVRRYLMRSVPMVTQFPAQLDQSVPARVAWVFMLVVPGVLGFVALWRRWRAATIALCLYGGALLVWPWFQARFLHPVLLLVLLMLAVGLAATGALAGRRIPAGVVAAGFALLFLSRAVPDAAAMLREAATCDRADPARSACLTERQRAFLTAARFARDSLPADAVIALQRDAAFAYHSNRRVVYAPEALGRHPDSLLQSLRAHRAQYILVAGPEVRDRLTELAKPLRRVCDSLWVRATFPGETALLALEPGPIAETAGNACGEIEYLVRTDSLARVRAREEADK